MNIDVKDVFIQVLFNHVNEFFQNIPFTTKYLFVIHIGYFVHHFRSTTLEAMHELIQSRQEILDVGKAALFQQGGGGA